MCCIYDVGRWICLFKNVDFQGQKWVNVFFWRNISVKLCRSSSAWRKNYSGSFNNTNYIKALIYGDLQREEILLQGRFNLSISSSRHFLHFHLNTQPKKSVSQRDSPQGRTFFFPPSCFVQKHFFGTSSVTSFSFLPSCCTSWRIQTRRTSLLVEKHFTLQHCKISFDSMFSDERLFLYSLVEAPFFPLAG